MPNVTEQILELAARLPEGTPVAAKSLLHLGSRAAVEQALLRLVRRGSSSELGVASTSGRLPVDSGSEPRRWNRRSRRSRPNAVR